MAFDYKSLFYDTDAKTGQQKLNKEFVMYALQKTKGRGSLEDLIPVYTSYAQDRENKRRKELGLDELQLPLWYDPSGRVDESLLASIYAKDYARQYGFSLTPQNEYLLPTLLEEYKKDKQAVGQYIIEQDRIYKDRARAKSLGVTYQEGMAFPVWDESSSLAKYYTYDNTEEDQTRKELGLPPVSYTNEFTGPEGKAAMLAGDMPASVQYTKNLLDAYDAFTQDVEALAKAGQLNDESYAAAFQKYPELADYQTYLNDLDTYNKELQALTPAQHRLAEIKGELPKAPKAYHNQAILEDVGLPDTFYNDLLAQGLELQKRSVPSIWEKILDFQYGRDEKGSQNLRERYEGTDTWIHRASDAVAKFLEPFNLMKVPEFYKDTGALEQDIENLKKLDQDTIGGTARRAWKAGQLMYLYNIEMAKEAMGIENQSAELKKLMDDPLFKTEAKGLFKEIVEASVQQTPRYYEAFQNLLIRGSKSPEYFAQNGLDQAREDLSDFFAIPGDITMMAPLYYEMLGAAYAGQLEAGVDPRVAANHAPIQAFVDSVIEVLQLGIIGKLAGKIGKKALASGGNVALRRILATVGGGAVGYVSEINEEILQEMNAILWEEIGKAVANKAYGTDLQSQDFNEIKSRLFGTTLEAAKALVPTALGATISSFQKSNPRVDMDVAATPGTDPKAVDSIKKVKAGVTLTESEAAMFAPGQEANRQTFQNATGVALPKEADRVSSTIESVVQEQQAKAGAAPAVEQEKDLGAPEAPGEQATVKAAQGETAPVYRVKKTGAAPDVQRSSTATKGRVDISPITYPDVTLDEKEVERAAKSALKDAGINTRRSVARQFVDELVSAYKAGEMDKFDERLADKSKELAAYAADHVNLATEEDYSVYNAVAGKEYYIPERYVKSSRKGYEADLAAARRQLHDVVKITTDRANGAVGIDTIADEIKSITGVDVGDSLFEIVEGLSDIVNRVLLDRARKKGMAGDYSAALEMTDAARAAELRTRAIERFAETGRTFEAKDREADKESLKKLADEMARENKNNVPVTVTIVAAETKRQQLIVKFAETLGLDVVYYKNTGKAQRNEFFDPENPGTIFINVNAPVRKHGGNYEWIFGHGLFHALDARGLVNDLRDFWVNEVYGAQEDAEMRGKIIEDLADNLGNAMADPAFWAQMRNYSPSLFNKIAEVVQGILEKVKRFLGRKDMEYVTLEGQSLADFREKMAGIIQSVAEAENDVVEAMAEARLLYSEWDGMQEHMEGLIEALDEDIAADEKAGRDTTQRKAARKAYQELLEEVRKTSLPKRLKRQVEKLIEYRTIGATAEKAEIRAKMDQEFRKIKAEDNARMAALKERLMGEMKQLKNETHRALQAMQRIYEDRRKADRELIRERFRVNAKRAQLRRAKTEVWHMLKKVAATAKTGVYRGKNISANAKAVLLQVYEGLEPLLSNRKYEGTVNLSGLYNLLGEGVVEMRDKDGNPYMAAAPDAGIVRALIEDLQGRSIKSFDEADMRHLRSIVKWAMTYPGREHALFVAGKKYELNVAQHIAAELIEKEFKKTLTTQQQKSNLRVFAQWKSLNIMRMARKMTGVDSGLVVELLDKDLRRGNRKYHTNLAFVHKLQNEIGDRLKKQANKDLFTKNDKGLLTVQVDVEINGKMKKVDFAVSRGFGVFVAMNAANQKNRNVLYNGGKDWNENTIPKLNDEAIDQIAAAVQADEELRWFKEKIMAAYDTAKAWYNEASLAAHGFEVATEPDYYPIEIDRTQFTMSLGFVSGTFDSLKNLVARVKRTKKSYAASSPVDLLFANLNTAARYNAFLLPVRNLKYFLFTPALANVVRQRLGEGPLEFYSDLIYDIEDGKPMGKGTDKRINKAISLVRQNVILAALTSVKASVKQSAAYWLTLRRIDSHNLIRGLVMPFTKEDQRQMEQKAALDANRAWTGPNYETVEAANRKLAGAAKVLRPFRHIGVNMMQRVDFYFIKRMWVACRLQAQSEIRNTTIKRGSEEFWQKVADMALDLTEETQTNFDPVLRSGIGNTDSEIAKVFTLFSTDRNQVYNLLYDFYWDMSHGHKGRAIRTLTGVLMSTATVSAIDILAAIWRRKDEEKGEEDENGAAFILQWAETLLGSSYFLAPIVTIMRGFGVGHIAFEGVEELIGDVRNILEHTDDEADAGANPALPYIRKFAFDLFSLLGVGVPEEAERMLVLPILARTNWKGYDAYARHTAMGLDGSDYYPYIVAAAERGDTAELQQLADVLAHYTADKIKAYNKKVLTDPDASKPQEKPYRNSNWYREAKKNNDLLKYQAFEQAYQTALLKWLNKP